MKHHVQQSRRYGALAALLVLLLALAPPMVGQSASSPTPAFEIADVRGSAERIAPNAGMSGGAIRNGIYELRNATMLDLIRTAYSVESDKVIGGPTWLEMDKFDVVAKAPATTNVETARQMLRGLLADRFKLAIREDKRDMKTWVLSEASSGSSKLVRAKSAALRPACSRQPEPPNVKATCRNMTISGFAEQLPRMAGSYVNGTVTDATGLTGAWDFDIVFTNNRAEVAEHGAKGATLFDALQKQLGLKLENKTIATTTLQVENVNRTPSPNPANVEKMLPPRPVPEFEVAEIKPTAPGNTQTRAQLLPSGLLNASSVPLRELINMAWGFNGDELVVGPKWIESARFDIIGRAFTGANAQFVDNEFLRLALRKLLVDRFQIKFHFEDRPVNAYALVAGNVKMTKADPASRTRCYPGVPAGAKDPRQANPTRIGILTCQNASMEYFAERLRGYAGGYFEAPITEKTGLKGGYDFTLNWSPIAMFPGGVNGVGRPGGPGGGPGGSGDAGQGNAGGGVGNASIPTGAITLPEAVESQLGLKLQMGKRPVSVLVIDHILQKPAS